MEPKIRLKGFSGEWEETTFGESVTINSGMDYKHLSDGDIPVYGTGGYMLSVNESLSEIDAIGIGRKGTIDKPQLLKAPFWTVDTLFFMTTKKGNDLKFFYALSQKTNWRKYDESTGVPSLSKINIAKVGISLPKEDEQQALGSYFQHLDSLIQSTTKKMESLKQVKAASLQSMFPQEGETTPRVRFKGFEGEWSVVVLGEVGTFKSNGVDKLIRPDEKMINLLNYLDVYNSRIITKENCSDLMHVSASDRQIKDCDVQKNDIFFTPSSETAEDIGYVLVMKDTLPNTCYSYHLMRYRPNEGIFFEDFPNYGFATKYVRSQMKLLAKGVQRYVIGKPEFESIKVQIPSFEEQKKIAEYFRSLDSQIFGQTQRLEKLKQIKSACLDNMFV